MQAQAQEQATTYNLPDPNEVQTSGNLEFWRIADGQLKKGSEQKGTLRTVPKLMGFLKRVGTHTFDDSHFVEAEIDYNGSTNVISVGLKSSVAAYMFVRGLLAAAPGDVVIIEPKQATQTTAGRRPSTFVNVYKYTGTKAEEIKVADFAGADSVARLDAALPAWAKHPAFAQRPQKSEGGAAWDAFDNLVVGKGWPGLHDTTAAWLEVIGKGFKTTFASLGDLTEEQWEKARASMSGKADCPKAVLDAKKATSTSTEDGFDPEADDAFSDC